MPLPELTHLQFLVLSILLDGERSGREVRERLTEAGETKSGPAFYQFMARLEDAGFVEGWYDQKVIDGQSIKERRYRIIGNGTKAWEDVRDFYLAHAGVGVQGA
jgi:DNA-binding PadR family transcriptional regulator